MTIENLFATPFYRAQLEDAVLLKALAHSAQVLAREDKAGRTWSQQKGYSGYTSYASLNDLPQRDPDFADLKRHLDRHVQHFAKQAHMDLGGRKLKLDSLWVNILQPGGGHSGHIHPHSIVSGTLYVKVPKGSGALRLEDPRLPLMMAAPARTAEAPAAAQQFFHAEPEVGTLFLWESWLRHEVMPNQAKSPRISISFNYG